MARNVCLSVKSEHICIPKIETVLQMFFQRKKHLPTSVRVLHIKNFLNCILLGCRHKPWWEADNKSSTSFVIYFQFCNFYTEGHDRLCNVSTPWLHLKDSSNNSCNCIRLLEVLHAGLRPRANTHAW